MEKYNVWLQRTYQDSGRDYIKTGNYIENFFKEKGIRYIAINDNIDSEDEESLELIEFRNVFNNFFPKDTSKKVRKIKKLKAEKGEYQRLTSSVPAIRNL